MDSQSWEKLRHDIKCANRQYRHNGDNSPNVFEPEQGFVMAYDIDAVERALSLYEAQQTDPIAELVESLRYLADQYQWVHGIGGESRHCRECCQDKSSGCSDDCGTGKARALIAKHGGDQ